MIEEILAARVTIDGQTQPMRLEDGLWCAESTASIYAGDYPITVELDTAYETLTYDGTAPVWGHLLTLRVRRDGKPVWLILYLPPYLRAVEEYQAAFAAMEPEIERLYDLSLDIYSEANFGAMSEDQVNDWEQRLGIAPQGDLAQRRTFIAAQLRGQGKLSGEKIKTIVRVFTGDDTQVELKGSSVAIRYYWPIGTRGPVPQWLAKSISRSITPRLPAHLALAVERYQSGWGDIKAGFKTWGDVSKGFGSWGGVLDYIPRGGGQDGS